MLRSFQVKQYIAIVKNSRGNRFQVFRTGDEQFYLFCQLYPEVDIATGLQIPIRKSDLRRDIRSALNHGWGNA